MKSVRIVGLTCVAPEHVQGLEEFLRQLAREAWKKRLVVNENHVEGTQEMASAYYLGKMDAVKEILTYIHKSGDGE